MGKMHPIVTLKYNKKSIRKNLEVIGFEFFHLSIDLNMKVEKQQWANPSVKGEQCCSPEK